MRQLRNDRLPNNNARYDDSPFQPQSIQEWLAQGETGVAAGRRGLEVAQCRMSLRPADRQELL
jgi:hypothetical protein